MLAVFRKGKLPREILDLTAPASGRDGIVERWWRDTLARTKSREAAKHPSAPEPEPPPGARAADPV